MQVDAIYTDFPNAFDKVNHIILVTKLGKIGFSEVLVTFFHMYLTGRRQYVNYKWAESYTSDCPSDAPQGSNLGSTLFLLFINDISNIIRHSHILLYADDIKLYKEIKTKGDSKLLQQDFDKLANWSTENSLPFNIKKCESITFTCKQKPLSFVYKIEGEQ